MPKNYNSAGLHTYAKSQNKMSVYDSTKSKRNWLTSIALLISLFFTGLSSNAQVSSSLNPTYGYTFSNTTSTFTSLGASGTVFQSGTSLDTNTVSAAITLPFVFTYNGIKESKIFISNNGFITFGIAPTLTQYTPISSTTSSGFNGVISGFGVNAVQSTAAGAAGEIRYGTKANGDFAIQFQDLGQAIASGVRMTFQIVLKADGKTIQIVYGPNNVGFAGASQCQVGLRGTSPQDFNNRTLASGGNWNTTGGAAGTVAQALSCTATTTLPTSGRTFQWSPTSYTPTYLATPFTTTQNFNSWTNGSGANNVPTTNWATNGYGSASWQIDNVSASSAGWTNGSGSYTPADYNGVAFAHSARFNSFNAATNQVGYLDYYVDLSGGGSFLALNFSTINTSGTDILQVFLSTDGGATFNQIGANIAASAVGWRAQKIPLGVVTSATSIIRFKGTADNGNTDIGIDNVTISPCVPNGNSFATAINLGALTTSVNYSGNNLSENCWTDNYTTTSTPGSPLARSGNDVFYKFQITECLSTLHIGTCNSDFDTYMHILDASGNTLFSDDDGCDNPLNGSNLGSYIVNMLLPIGTYYVVVEGRSASDTGEFILSFSYSPGSPVPAPTGLACYQTATFNEATCTWVVTGTQPAMPTLACYQTAVFNNTTCAWVVTGSQPTTQVPNTIISEGFDNFSSLATAGWSVVNTSTPVGAGVWSQGTSDWAAQSGASTSWARVDYSSVLGNNTISNWLIAPQKLLKNGDVITFWTRTAAPVSFPDRLQVRLSTTGAGTNPTSPTDVGSYTTLLADINPTLTTIGYPTTFTQYTLTVSGLSEPTNCRVAFRYFVTGGGPSGANSNTIGIDTFSITRALPPLACYESYVFNGTTCQYDVTGTQPVMPTLACYETATFNNTTCVWDVTGTQPTMPTLACYETAIFNGTTCVWEVTGTQPMMPTLACYETATFNSGTCVWDVIGTQPTMPTLACYETATFNGTTCIWDVTGTQPTMPTLACYEKAIFNTETCVWDVTGTQPIMPTVACYESATFNSDTCVWDVTGTQPTMPTLACYESATFNSDTCVWDVTGTQPTMPTLACYESATFNSDTCVWDVTGTQPTIPTLACYETATFNTATCVWDVTGTQPTMPTLACYESAIFNSDTCTWDVTGTQPTMPTLACYETAAFNGDTCTWDVTGTQPTMPTLACYETAAFNGDTCTWDVTGTQPTMPTLACYESAIFNSDTCVWDVTGTQPIMPTLACYEKAIFNTKTCVWDVIGTQPTMPTLACYETATFNGTTCIWDVTGTQPIMPTLACYESAIFNSNTCVWDVTGTQPTMPTLACYESAIFNSNTCVWDVTGTQPTMPTLACYESATFNSDTCVWDVTGTQPIMPTVACYESAIFNSDTCVWDVTGTQPIMPTLACYETAAFNSETCTWDVTGTQPTIPTLACYETATFNNTTCVWDVTGTQPIMPTLACYESATFNSDTCVWDVTGTQPIMPTVACYETAAFNGDTCTWDVTGTQPTMPTLACYETAAFNSETCTWAVTGTQPTMPTVACYETATFNTETCAWAVTGTQPTMPTVACYETATFNNGTCAWDVTGTQPIMPTLLCYQTATFSNNSCSWIVTGTQPTLGSVTITSLGSYTWTGPYGNGTTYTTSGIYTSTIGCNVATLNLTITVNTLSLGSSCGATINGLAVTITTPFVAGVAVYTFKLTNLNTNAVQIISRPVNSFALSNYAGITLGTPYQVEVSVNGGASYGTPCTFNTPSPTSTIGAQCGTTLTSMGQWIYATYHASITGYRFRITNTTTNAVVVYDAPNGLNKFNFNQLPIAFRTAGTTYFVEVALRNTNATYLPYSAGCAITTPGSAPMPTKGIVANTTFKAITYPNPFENNFMFDVTTTSESTIQISVYDMLGRQVENRNVEASAINNLQVGDAYPSGVYNVIVSQGENTQTLRVIKR